MGSFWNDFLDNVTPDSWETVTTGLGTGIKAVSDVADKVVPDAYEEYPSISGNRVTMVPDTNRPRVAGTVFNAATAMVAKPVEAASAAMVKAETYGFGRPISVGAQVFDRNNPLYQDGVQFSDLNSMWEASQNTNLTGATDVPPNPGISGGQSAWSSILYGIKSGDVGSVLSYFGPSGPPMLAANLLDRAMNPDAVHGTASPANKAASNYNLYDPIKQQKLYNDTTFALLSGVSDTALQIYGLGKMGDSLAGNAKKAVGLDTMIDSARDVNKVGGKMMEHFAHTESEGAVGKWNVYGYWAEKAAASTSAADIAANPLFKGSPKAVEIGSMLEGVSDRVTVAKVWAADHGDQRAVAALLRDDPDFAWRMTDGNFKVQMQAVMGDLPTINSGNSKFVASVYDRPLERPGNEFYASARDIFLGKVTTGQVEAGTAAVEDLGKINATNLNSRSKPFTGIAGKTGIKVAESRQDAAMGRSVIPDGDGWVSSVLGKIGGAEPTTVMIQWMGARRPSGQIAWGLSPTGKVDEMMAAVGRLPFARGQREFQFERDGVTVPMTGEQWRQEAYSRLALAARQGDTAERDVIASLEGELISATVKQFGLTADEAKAVADLALKGRDSSLMAAKETGFFFDSSANRMMMHPQTQRQLVDSYTMFPIEEFAREARMVMRGTQGKNRMGTALLKGRHRADLVYELVQKYVRTEQLIRPSYMKNSLVEPIGARLAYEGVDQLAPLSKDFAKGAGNWFVNRVRAQGGHAYWVGDKLKLSKGSRMSSEAFRVHNQRQLAEDELDQLIALRDVAKGENGFSPNHVDYLNRYTDGAVRDAKARVHELWAQADVADPGWHTTHQAPTFSELSAEVTYLTKTVNDPEALAKIDARIAKLSPEGPAPTPLPEGTELKRTYMQNGQYSDTPIVGNDAPISSVRIDAMVNGLPAGHIMWDNADGKIYSLMTESRFRRQGIATALYKDAIKYSDEQGFKKPIHDNTTEDAKAWIAGMNNGAAHNALTPAQEAAPAFTGGTPMFHGTSKAFPNDQLDEVFNLPQSQNMLGAGLYSTDSRAIASTGYTLKGGGGDPATYSVHWKGSTVPKVLDAEKPAPKFLRDWIKREHNRPSADMPVDGSYALADDASATSAQLIKAFREDMAYGGGVPRSEAEDIMNGLNEAVQAQGYDAMSHLGGAARGGAEHNVTIWLDTSKVSVKRVADNALTPAQESRLADLTAERARIEAIQSDPLLTARVNDIADSLATAAKSRLAMVDGSPAEKIATVQAKIDALDSRLAALNVRQSADRMKRERYAKRSTQTDGKMSVKVGNVTLTGDKPLAQRNFGEAKRNEFSADYTNRATFDPGQTSIANAQVLSMAHDSVEVKPFNPRYWDEHAYVVNRHLVGDEYATMILQGKSNSEILTWFDTPGGQAYLKNMEWDRTDLTPKPVGKVENVAVGARKRGSEIKGMHSERPVPVWDSGQINTFRRELNKMLPTQAARDAVLDGPVSAGQMQKLTDGVSMPPIAGRNVQLAKTGTIDSATGRVKSWLDLAWKKLASDPENFISRWPFATKLFKTELATRLRLLAEQGVPVDSAHWNALQDSVTKFTLSESKKTFYNISHYSNPVYAARYLFVYPQAVFNTMWRAARLTYRRPGSALAMNEAWTQFFSANAVDENGDVTHDYNNAKSVAITIPKVVSDAIGSDPQVNFPVNAMNLLSSKMGANWTVTLPLQTLLLHKPEMTPMLKQALGPGWDSAFPFGVPSNLDAYTILGVPVGNWIPNYAKSAIAALQWDNESFTRVSSQQHEYDLALWYKQKQLFDAGQGPKPGPVPDIASSVSKATKYWVATAVAQFDIPGGGGLRTAGSLERDAIRVILNKYNGDREAAMPEIQQAFPNLDPSPLMASTSEYSAYVPPTQEAYAVLSDPAVGPLFTQLAQENNTDMAELLVADKQGEFDANIYDKFGSTPVPGSSEPIRKRASTAEVDARVAAGKSWDSYTANRNMIMAEVTRQGLKQMPAAVQTVWNAWVDDFRSRPENAAWSREQGKRDGTRAFSAFKVLQDGLSAPSMEKYRNTSYWIAAKQYVDNFPVVLDAYRKAPNPQMRAGIAQIWDTYVSQNIGVQDPTFQRMYDKFFAGVDVEM